jgi:hypothetical protein
LLSLGIRKLLWTLVLATGGATRGRDDCAKERSVHHTIEANPAQEITPVKDANEKANRGVLVGAMILPLNALG